MSETDRPAKLTGATEPIIAAYRERILYALAVIATVVLLPFSIGNFVKGYLLIGAVSMTVVLVFVADAAAIYLRRRLPVPIPVAFVIIMVALVIAIWGRGLLGIFWTFPAILLFHFVLERRLANLFNLTLVGLVGGVAYYSLDADVTLRIVAGQLLTIVFTNIFSYVVEAEQRKETEQRRRLGLLVRATNAGFFQWDRASDERVYSGRLKEMLGYHADTDTSAWPPLPALMHPEDRERRVSLFQAGARQGGRPGAQRLAEGGDFRLRHANGDYLWVHAQGLFIHGDDGRVARYIASLVDVSERYSQQEQLRSSHNQIQVQAQQLRDQNAALRDAMRVREEVERIARHDLKTPLNSIVAVPRMLRERRKPDAVEEALLGMVEGAAYRVLDMVNLSVDLYRMEQGDYSFSPRAVDLGALARTVSREVAAHAATKGVVIERIYDEGAYAWGSELLCYSILANVLKNAVEASPDGGTVRLEFAASGAGVDLRVRNDGEVPEGIRDRFFEKYTTSGKIGGFGLGTYSARLMARVQQGELLMETSPEAGTLLTLRLPALPAGVLPEQGGSEARPEPAPSAPLSALRVLVVDDDEFNIAFVRSCLPSPPLTVATAINGRAALDAARASEYEVVFMDLEMPVMNGFEALHAIRSLEADTGRKPAKVIAFSSYDDEAIRRQCVGAGFDGYLSKPAPRERLHAILRAAAAGQQLPEATLLPQASAGPDDPVNVDPDLRAALPRFLETRRALIDELRGSLAAGDRDAARRHAHKLAGSLALYGFAWAAAESRALQHAAADADPAELAGRAQALQRHLESVRLTDGENRNDGRAPQAAAG